MRYLLRFIAPLFLFLTIPSFCYASTESIPNTGSLSDFDYLEVVESGSPDWNTSLPSAHNWSFLRGAGCDRWFSSAPRYGAGCTECGPDDSHFLQAKN